MTPTIKVDLLNQADLLSAFEKIKILLGQGGVIAFPTDTFYGLGANPFNERAVADIFKIKKRSPQKPILTLINSIKQLDQLACDISPDAEKLIQNLWPGPLTLIFKALPHLPRNLTSGTGKIGVRLPDHEFSRQLIQYIDHPLTASSANLSGHPNSRTAEEVGRMDWNINLIVDGGKTAGGTESMVLDTTFAPPKLVREGSISKMQIESILNMELTRAE